MGRIILIAMVKRLQTDSEDEADGEGEYTRKGKRSRGGETTKEVTQKSAQLAIGPSLIFQ